MAKQNGFKKKSISFTENGDVQVEGIVITDEILEIINRYQNEGYLPGDLLSINNVIRLLADFAENESNPTPKEFKLHVCFLSYLAGMFSDLSNKKGGTPC